MQPPCHSQLSAYLAALLAHAGAFCLSVAFCRERALRTLGLGKEYRQCLEPVPECLACGTCCFSWLNTFVRVSGADYSRLAERADALVWFDGNRAYMRMLDGHCGALRMDVLAGQFICSTYATRPQVCRDLERASGACLGEREVKAARPLLALGLSRGSLTAPLRTTD